MMSMQLTNQQQMRYDLDQLRDMTQGVQDGIVNSMSQAAAREKEFMMSRQTLRPKEQADTLKGATIVTQLNRDNLESFGGPSAGGNDEIDDLRRE